MSQFRIKSPSIIHETINDEAVVVNLDSGVYFSLDGAASLAWDALVAGRRIDEVAAIIAATYQLPLPDAQAHVATLLEQLRQHELLVPAENEVAYANFVPPAATPKNAAAKPFTGMTLHVYRDMEELLMLDPIHDVTAAGWPNTPVKS